MKKILLLLSFTTLIQISFGQKQRLGFNLTVGQTYYHLMEVVSNVKQEINGQINTVNVTMSGKMAFNVTSMKDSIYAMSVTYEQLSMTMKLANGEMTFNSEKNDPNDIFSNI